MPKTFDLYEPFYQPTNRAEPLSRFDNITVREFAPRLALRCLWTLQRELEPPQVDPQPNWDRDNLLGLLQSVVKSK